jgi:tetratricopeptide (TPR) repeat protein
LIGLKEGDAPHEIVIQDINGKTVSMSSSIGKKPVIILFWELKTNKAFLDYSLNALQYLGEMHNKYHDKHGLEIVGIYTPVEDKKIPETEIAAVRNLISGNKIPFPILIDRGFKTFKDYGVIALPSMIMINKSGLIDFIYPSFPIAARPLITDKIMELTGIVEVSRKRQVAKRKEADTKSKRLYYYAVQMYKKNLHEQAHSALNKSIELTPDDSWAHNLMGIILWKKGINDSSMEEFKRAIELDKKNIVAHLNYTVMLVNQGKYDEAENFLKTSPTAEINLKIRAHHLLGKIYMKTNRIDKAIEELELAYSLYDIKAGDIIDAKPPYISVKVSIIHDLSLLYNKKGNGEKALELLQEALHEVLGLTGSIDTEQIDQRLDFMLYE